MRDPNRSTNETCLNGVCVCIALALYTYSNNFIYHLYTSVGARFG